ncbi:unnamed protein product [Dibothriocephalus latus]|uniref:Hexosyltransferase n=1 Tax=Dibothriocephalus latus TaxID=60516 RepID=A0A3P7L683_DIBLA|nr:unnamed protein product [Dibothriocephalus latus]
MGLISTIWLILPQWKPLIETPASLCQSDWQCLRYSQQTNSFELSLEVQDVKKDGQGRRNTSADRWILGPLSKRDNSTRKPYTFADMTEIADEDWLQPIPRSAFLLYPQALDIKQVVDDIRKNRPIPEVVRLLIVSSTVCVPDKAVNKPLDAIVVIKSAVYNFEDRKPVRSAYAKEAESEPAFRMATVFSLGLPRSSGGRYFKRDGINISLPGRAGASLEKMQSRGLKVLRQLAEEAQRHGDLVLGDYEDTYYKLSLTLFHTFQWASRFCRGHVTHQQQRPPVFILLDDDYAFNASRLKAELDALSDAQLRRLVLGSPMNGSKVYRPLVSPRMEKWVISKRQVPWPYFAPYGSGAFLVLGADVLQEIALAMYFNVQFPVDDAWLGMVMTKLNLYVQQHPHMHINRPKADGKELVLFAPFDYLFGG